MAKRVGEAGILRYTRPKLCIAHLHQEQACLTHQKREFIRSSLCGQIPQDPETGGVDWCYAVLSLRCTKPLLSKGGSSVTGRGGTSAADDALLSGDPETPFQRVF